TINTDEVKLKQILMNLLSNSFKFTISGEIVIESEHIYDHSESQNYIRILIADTGIGIPEDKIDKLKSYTPFTKLESVTNRYGLGIGLVIVKSLVELLGKDLQINSEENKGTTVSFKLLCNNTENNIQYNFNRFNRSNSSIYF